MTPAEEKEAREHRASYVEAARGAQHRCAFCMNLIAAATPTDYGDRSPCCAKPVIRCKPLLIGGDR